jgi:RNA polymerase sigma-70 factor (ECF subfamily)
MENGDLAYFSSLNLSKVWEFSLRLSRDQSIAEHLVEHAYARVLDGGAESLANSSAVVRLFTLVYSIWNSSFRQSSLLGINSQHWRQVPVFSGEQSGDRPCRQSKGQQLIEAIEGLPETMRISLMLLTVESLSYADIAIVINQTVGAVVASVLQARAIVHASCGSTHV